MRKINKSDKIWHFTDAFKNTASIQYQYGYEQSMILKQKDKDLFS